MKYTKQQQEEVKHFLEFLDIRTGIKNLEFSNADVITDMQEEIKRLNNIINELEKDFERKIQSCTIEAETTTNDFYCRLHIATLKRWLNKIKEIKGADSNE